MNLPASAVAEIERLKAEVERLSMQTPLTRSDAKKLDGLLAQISVIRMRHAHTEEKIARITDEQARARVSHETAFRSFMAGKPTEQVAQEARTANDLLAGAGTVAFSEGPAGGVLVPMQFQKSVSEGLAAVDPLLSPDVCTVVQEPTFSLKPLQLPGWDLSTIKATKVGEATQHNADVVPGLTQKSLNKFTYRLSLGASLEWDEDQQVFDSALTAAGRAFGIGFARGIGEDCVIGAGDGTAPMGILTGAADSGYTTTSRVNLTVDDFDSIFFAVNLAYRNSPKAAWLMGEATYRVARKAADQGSHLLFALSDGTLMIYGKPAYICPSMPTEEGTNGIVFGDLSHYTVHVSTMFVRRRLQAPGYVENGKYLLTGLMMADAVLNDPTDGAMPPVVFAKLGGNSF